MIEIYLGISIIINIIFVIIISTLYYKAKETIVDKTIKIIPLEVNKKYYLNDSENPFQQNKDYSKILDLKTNEKGEIYVLYTINDRYFRYSVRENYFRSAYIIN